MNTWMTFDAFFITFLMDVAPFIGEVPAATMDSQPA